MKQYGLLIISSTLFFVNHVTAVTSEIVLENSKINSSQDWGEEIYKLALDKNWEEIEKKFGGQSAVEFGNAYKNYLSNKSQAKKNREKIREESLQEAIEAYGENNIGEALKKTLEYQTYNENRITALDNENIKKIIASSYEKIPEYYTSNKLLHARELIVTLRELFDLPEKRNDYNRLDEDLRKLGRKLILMARYAPTALYKMRVALAEDRGDPAPRPVTEIAQSRWKERTEKSSKRHISKSIWMAARKHVNGSNWAKMLSGGIQSVKALLQTAGTSESFPEESNDPDYKEALIEWLGEESTRFRIDEKIQKQSHHKLSDSEGFQSCSRIVESLEMYSSKGVGIPLEVLLTEFAEGALGELDDYTNIIWPSEMRQFRQMTKGEFVGVGIQISEGEAGEIIVSFPIEGTPAFRAGVRSDDIIEEVDGKNTLGWSLSDAVENITGPKGTIVTLGIRRSGEDALVLLTMPRDRINLKSVYGWRKTGLDDLGRPEWDWYADRNAGIAYVRLSQFSDDTYQELLDAIEKMHEQGELKGIILDLRYNGGGLLESARDISNLFFSTGEIVSAENRDGETLYSIKAETSKAFLQKIQTVVLVNPGSASASEIVSGSIQAHGSGIILGERTYGKGSIQTVEPVNSDQTLALKVTTQMYRLPAASNEERGRLVHRQKGANDWGVNPDIRIPVTPEEIKGALEYRSKADLIALGESQDNIEEERPNPDNLFLEGIDRQIETALLLLKAITAEELSVAQGE